MKRSLQIHSGLLLIAIGVVYAMWYGTSVPAWGWALLGSAFFFALAHYRNLTAAVGYGALFLGWGLGALASDVTGLQSLKLVGGGLGLITWGYFEKASWATLIGGAMAISGFLVFAWEASIGGWLAMALLAAGLYLALREPKEAGPQEPRAGSDERLAAIIRWRNEEARRRGVENIKVLSDEEVGCLAALPETAGPEDLAGCLNGDENRARALWDYLKAR